jgi:protein-S-isoprenylcysteine O-methyltransferase Ste14
MLNKKIKAGILVTLQFGILGALALDSHFSNNTTYLPATTFAMLFGLTIILLAYFNLRPSLKISPIPKSGAPLIAFGIYKYVRHPMYLGVLSIGVSLSANANNLLGWLLWLCLLVTLKIKAKFEDSLLREIHPEAIHYQMHTSAILPCLGGSCRESCNLKAN